MKIPWLKELSDLEDLKTLEDVLRLNSFVFSLVPHSGNVGHQELDLMKKYQLYKDRLISDWCYGNALFLSDLVNEFQKGDSRKPSVTYNYGIAHKQLTHCVSLVNIEDEVYLLDPYFCRYFVESSSGKALTFEKLLQLVKDMDFKEIKPVYGNSTKPVMQQHYAFQDWTPQMLEGSVINSWKKLREYDSCMIKEFGNTNPLLLLLLKT